MTIVELVPKYGGLSRGDQQILNQAQTAIIFPDARAGCSPTPRGCCGALGKMCTGPHSMIVQVDGVPRSAGTNMAFVEEQPQVVVAAELRCFNFQHEVWGLNDLLLYLERGFDGQEEAVEGEWREG